jgi:hypothetical protein
MVARWIPVPKVACSIHVAFILLFFFCLMLLFLTANSVFEIKRSDGVCSLLSGLALF